MSDLSKPDPRSPVESVTYWLLKFEDPDKRDEIFTDEAAAGKRYADCLLNWNCHLFVSSSEIARLTTERDLARSEAADAKRRVEELQAESSAAQTAATDLAKKLAAHKTRDELKDSYWLREELNSARSNLSRVVAERDALQSDTDNFLGKIEMANNIAHRWKERAVAAEADAGRLRAALVIIRDYRVEDMTADYILGTLRRVAGDALDPADPRVMLDLPATGAPGSCSGPLPGSGPIKAVEDGGKTKFVAEGPGDKKNV